MPLCKEFVTVLDDLVRAADQIEVMLLTKLLDDIGAEGVRNAALVGAPSLYIFVGVGPKQITQ